MKRLNEAIVFRRCRPGAVSDVKSCSVTTAGTRNATGSVPCGPHSTPSAATRGSTSCCHRTPSGIASTRTATVTRILNRVDINSYELVQADTLNMNDVAHVTVSLGTAVAVEAYAGGEEGVDLAPLRHAAEAEQQSQEQGGGNGKAEIVGPGDESFRREYGEVVVPAVLCLTRFVKVPCRTTVPLTRRAVLARDGWLATALVCVLFHECRHDGPRRATFKGAAPLGQHRGCLPAMQREEG